MEFIARDQLQVLRSYMYNIKPFKDEQIFQIPVGNSFIYYLYRM